MNKDVSWGCKGEAVWVRGAYDSGKSGSEGVATSGSKYGPSTNVGRVRDKEGLTLLQDRELNPMGHIMHNTHLTLRAL